MSRQWNGDKVTLDMPNQALALSCASYAAYFGIPAENVLIRSPFLGGGFGSKAILNGPQILAILAARMLGRPVKLALTRSQMYGPVGHRGQTWQKLRIGTDTAGRLTALHHSDCRHLQLRRFHRACRQRIAAALRQPGDPRRTF